MNFLRLIFILVTLPAFCQSDKVSVLNTSDGMKLIVNGQDFIINGMNWDYVPIGKNYSYSLWEQSDDFIKAALEAEVTRAFDNGSARGSDIHRNA